MNDNDNQIPVHDQISKQGASRREFIGKAAVTAPVLAAFVSKPSWSVEDNCISSGSLSGNLSNHGCQALARNWEWWSKDANRSLWDLGQIPGVAPTTSFKAIFNSKPLARQESNNEYFKLNNNGKKVLLSIGNSVNLKQILNGHTKNNPARRAAEVDKAVIAAYLNIMHPGIAYSGYNDPSALFADYETALANYLVSYDNLIFDELYDKLEGINGYNNNVDQTPGG